jgi:hypothetical protein
LEEKVAKEVSNTEALCKMLDTEAIEHSALQVIVTPVYDTLEAGDIRPGSSLQGRVEALYT